MSPFELTHEVRGEEETHPLTVRFYGRLFKDSSTIQVNGEYNRRIPDQTDAGFLDISNAYDTTWHTGLIYKLIEMELPGDLIKIIVVSKSEVYRF